jgi:hypothetical protein
MRDHSSRPDDLFHFEWYVDEKGYEAVPAQDLPEGVPESALQTASLSPGQGFDLKRKGGRLRRYRPLVEEPGLARWFAYLKRRPPAYLDFANRFGFLGVGCTEHPDVHEWREHSWWWDTHVRGFLGVVESIDAGDKFSIASIFNHYVEPRMAVRIETARAKRPILKVVPLNLIDWMWLQVAGELTAGTKYRECKWCSRWFPYGKGTGHRETKRFCSDPCRKAWNRHSKGEEK